MKIRVSLILFAISTFHLSNGQTLNSLFVEMAEFGGMSKSERELLIENYQNNKTGFENGVGSSKHFLTVFSPKNGYLVYGGAYEGTTTMTYWNLSNGNKLIGLVKSSCGGVCDEDLEFYLKTHEGISQLELSQVILEIDMSDFFDQEKMKKDGLTKPITNDLFEFYPFMYQLPSDGKNLTIRSQTHELGSIPSELVKYDLGWELELVWNDGNFIKKDRL